MNLVTTKLPLTLVQEIRCEDFQNLKPPAQNQSLAASAP